MKNAFIRVAFFITTVLFVSVHAVAAAPLSSATPFTQGDFSCVLKGGKDGGTCSYDPTPSCSASGGASQTGPSSGITVDNSAAQKAAQAASAKVGYALYDSSGKLLASYNDTFENYGASITKSMLLVAYLKQVGSGSLSSQATSELTNMIENSDNASANWVWNHLSSPASDVTNVASAAGMTGFKLDHTSDPIYVLGQSKITANDFAKFFSKIDTMFPSSQKSFALKLLSNLSSTDQNGLLQAGLPGTVYSKEGWKPESSGLEGAPYIVNQAAQFSSGGTTYGVAVTVGGTSDQASGEKIVKNVVSALVSAASAPTTNPGTTSCCSSSSGGVLANATSGAQGGSWNSGLKPPYIIEEYAINVLEDLAQKMHKANSDAVTKQHVLALVAWAYIEGGDINNSDLFNLYNTTLTGSGLGATMQSTGSPAYSSFDNGVEATARTLASGHGGMAKVLLDPNSTAQDFAHAESYSGTSSYPGTQEWAGAAHSDPSGYQTGTWYPMIQQVKSSYKPMASLVIGTPALELITNKTAPGKLSNISSGGFSPSPASTSCSSSQGANNIVQEALKLAWPEPFGQQKPGSEPSRTSALTPTAAYEQAMRQYNPTGLGIYNGADCGVFVSTVMRSSGADPNYPASGTGSQWSYVVSHPKLYNIQYNVTSMSQLQPGDVLIVGGPGGAGAAGHTWIYVGKQSGGYYSASASLGGRSGNLTNDQLTDPAASGGYIRVRLN